MVRKKNKNSINYLEFEGGYALVNTSVIDAIVDGYRQGSIRKNELRAFAAILECNAMHKDSKVDLYRIINQGTGVKGVKRLTNKEINASIEIVTKVIATAGEGEKKPVARKFLRYIAKGSASGAQAILLLYYCKRRTRQPKQYDRLAKNERYARFKYGDLSELSGLRRATLSEALGKLIDRGLLNTAPVAKQSENFYGMLYIDGARVSLTRMGEYNTPYRRSTKKTVSPLRENRMAPTNKTATLINKDPKTRIKGVSSIELRKRNIDKMRVCLNSSCATVREIAERHLSLLEDMHEQAA